MLGKIFDSELKLMGIIWENDGASAKEIAKTADTNLGWNKNTTYTVLKKLTEKGYISRTDPGFICTALVSRGDVQKSETGSLLTKLFNGSRKAMFSALIAEEELSESELEELRSLIEKR